MAKDRHSVNVPVDGLPGKTHIKIEVYYSKGGMNYFSGGSDPRGYWLSAVPVEAHADGLRFSMLLGDPMGTRIFLSPATRLNANALTVLVMKVRPAMEEIAAAIAAGNKHGAARAARTAAGVAEAA